MNYQYFGLFLDEPTRNKLMQVIIGNPIICNLVFQRGSTIYLDHCTLLHKNQHEEKMANDLQYRIDGNQMLNLISLFVQSTRVNQQIAMVLQLGFQFQNLVFIAILKQYNMWGKKESYRRISGQASRQHSKRV